MALAEERLHGSARRGAAPGRHPGAEPEPTSPCCRRALAEPGRRRRGRGPDHRARPRRRRRPWPARPRPVERGRPDGVPTHRLDGPVSPPDRLADRSREPRHRHRGRPRRSRRRLPPHRRAATRSPWSSAAAVPGGRRACCVTRRLHLRHRPHGADHARPDRRRAARPRAATSTPLQPDAAARPGLPRPVRRRQHHLRPPRPRGDARGDRRDLRQRRRRRVRRSSSTGCASSTWSRCRTSSTATSTPRSTCCRSPRAAAQLLRLGGFGRLGAAVRRASTTRGCTGCSASRPCTPGWRPTTALALYAVITYMDSIEGVWFPDGGMHAVPRGDGRRRGEGRRRAPLRRVGHRVDPAARRPAGSPVSRLAGGETITADAVVLHRSTCPVAYEQLLPDLRPPRARPATGDYSPSASVWHVGVRGCRGRDGRAPQHPLRRAVGASAFDALLKDGT